MVWPIIACIPDPEQNDAPERLPRAEGCAGGWETGFSETNPAGIPQRIGPPLSASVYEPLDQPYPVRVDLSGIIDLFLLKARGFGMLGVEDTTGAHRLEGGCDMRTVQQFLGHKHVKTTMVYNHLLYRGAVEEPAAPSTVCRKAVSSKGGRITRRPVRIRGVQLLNTQEVVTSKEVCRPGWRRLFRLGPTRADFIQAVLNKSCAAKVR